MRANTIRIPRAGANVTHMASVQSFGQPSSRSLINSTRCIEPLRRGQRCICAQQRDPNQATTRREREWNNELQPDSSSVGKLAVTASPHHKDAEEEDEVAPHGIGARWDAVPGRYKAVFATSMAFVLCNMDKVNISVAIIPMAQDFGWSPTISGLVQSSFFYGYLLSQIPGGLLSSVYGGRTMLPGGVGLWSLATAAAPIMASTVPGLFISRAAVGLGEGVAPSAATDIVARIIAPEERSRATSFIFGGLHVGSLLGLLIAPAVIENFGWPVVFYLFGGAGLLWAVWWEKLIGSIAEKEPELAALLTPDASPLSEASQDTSIALHSDVGASHGGHGGVISHREPVPWRGFLRNRPVQALAYTHFCNNWFHYTMLAWLPTYFTDTLSLDLTSAATVSILPPIAAIAVSAIAGPTADSLISRGVDVASVRKAAQCAAFLGPAAGLLAACWTDDGITSVALITFSLGLASFSLAGLYCNHADLSPRYAPVLLGFTNTCGAIPGIAGVTFTGWLFDKTGSWALALFAPSVFFFLTGAAVFTAFASADRQNFTKDSEVPFAIERLWNPAAFLNDKESKDE